MSKTKEKIELLAGRGQVIVEIDPPEERTEGGIHLPDGGVEQEVASGTVIASQGEEHYKLPGGTEGVRQAFPSEEDTVLWDAGMGFYFDRDGVKYCSLYEEEIRAVIR